MTEARPVVAIIGTRGYPSFYGGFETAVRYLAPYLADNGWNVRVYGRPTEATGAGDQRVEAVETRGLSTKSLSTLTFGATAARHALKRGNRPDVILVMNVANGYFLPLFKLASIPTIVNVDGIEWEREKWGRLARTVFRGGAELTARFADELVVDAEAIGSRWQARWGRSGRFIPYGGEPRDAHLPAPLGLKSGSYILAVARLVPENSVAEFLEAAAVLSNTIPVVLVGSSGHGGELERVAAELDAGANLFKWLGQVRDDDLLHALWQNCGVYFHGHSVGGTNPALVQAMSLGVPTIARDTVFNREVLGSLGAFWDPTTDLAEALEHLLSQRARLNALGSDASARAKETYNWPAVCEQYHVELTQLLQGGG